MSRLACVELVNHLATGEVFHVYLNPERDMPDEAFEIHGLSEKFSADKPRFEAIADDFLGFIEDALLVIHNASFDMKFLNAELARSSVRHFRRAGSRHAGNRTRKHPGGSNSLDALCRRFGIDNSGRTSTAHCLIRNCWRRSISN